MWLAKLQRMMDELPEKYLQAGPSDPEELALIPLGSELVSRLTEEEKRLDGVCRQLWDMVQLEVEAHNTLHENQYPSEVCLRHNAQMCHREEEMQIISAILVRSLSERLGFENDYAIAGHDVYAIPTILDEALRAMKQKPGNEPEMPDGMNIPGLRGWSGTKH